MQWPHRLRKRTVVLALALFVFAVVLLHRQLLPLALHWLDVGEAPRKTDAVYVMLGETDVRPFIGAALVKAGYAKEVVFAKFEPVGLTRQQRPEHLVYRDIMIKRGVPESSIRILDHAVVNTFTETEAIGSYIRENPEATLTVVTNHYHTRRTRWSVRHHLGDQARRVHYVSAPHDDFGHNDWWLHMRGFDYVMIECIKLTAYFLLFGNGLLYVCLGVFSLVATWLWRRHRLRTTIR